MIVPDLALIGQGSQTSPLTAGLVIGVNVMTLLGSLYGFFKWADKKAEERFKRLVMPTLRKHTRKDEKQFKATNRVLKRLEEMVRQHGDRIERLEQSYSSKAGP